MSDHPTPAPSEAGETRLTGDQRARGCWICACGAVRMVWDFCGHCRMVAPETPATPTGTPAGETCPDCAHATTKHDAETGECAACRREWFADRDAGHPGVCYRVPPALPVDGGAGEPTAEVLARRFHEAYERLAPAFGYKTREASAKPWDEVPENNRRLMTAVCAEVLATVATLEAQLAAAERINVGWKRVHRQVEDLADEFLARAVAAEQERDRLREAATHAADEIKGKRLHGSDRYWKSYDTRVYWSQVEYVLRDALATLAPTGEPE